jgi:hypothetical protein
LNRGRLYQEVGERGLPTGRGRCLRSTWLCKMNAL